MSKQPRPAPIASTIGPCPTLIQIGRTPRHWKLTQHLRTTRPSPVPKQSSTVVNAIVHGEARQEDTQALFIPTIDSDITGLQVNDDDDDFMFNDASTHWVICVYKAMFYYLKCKIYLNCTSKRLCYSLKIYIVLSTFGCLKRTRMEKLKIVNGLRFKRFRFC